MYIFSPFYFSLSIVQYYLGLASLVLKKCSKLGTPYKSPASHSVIVSLKAWEQNTHKKPQDKNPKKKEGKKRKNSFPIHQVYALMALRIKLRMVETKKRR